MRLVKKHGKMRATVMMGIGRFMVEFSQLEFTLRAVLAGRLNLPDGLFDIVTSSYDFYTLSNVWYQLNVHQHPELKKDYKKLFDRLRALNDQRNRIAHGMWSDDTEGMQSRHVNKQRLEADQYFFNIEGLDAEAKEAQQLLQAVIQFKPAPRATKNAVYVDGTS